MKHLLLLCLALSPVPALAQSRKPVPTYTSKMGTVFHKGDTLHLGMGKADSGIFRYAYVPPNMLTGQMFLNSEWNNLNPVIKDIRAQKTQNGTRTVAVIGAGMMSAYVDIDSAEEAGEIKTANNKPKAAPVSSTGVADELLKLKALLDSGALTQAEFDAQKAKLLNK